MSRRKNKNDDLGLEIIISFIVIGLIWYIIKLIMEYWLYVVIISLSIIIGLVWIISRHNKEKNSVINQIDKRKVEDDLESERNAAYASLIKMFHEIIRIKELELYATSDDPYANLFDTNEDNTDKKEESSDKKTDVVDDLMGFFDEEE